jgi:hypothetical protein
MQDPQIWGVRNIKHQLGFSSRIKQRKRPVHLMMSDLRWNFNIENKLGVGWHSLPGYPASHSCLRLETPNFYMSGLMNGS